jgi:hypothetical protein
MPADDRWLRDCHWRTIIQTHGDGLVRVGVQQDELLANVHPLPVGQSAIAGIARFSADGIGFVTSWTEHN